MSSAEDSHAKTSALPAKGPVWLGIVPAFGGATQTPFASFDPDSLSWRTLQLSLLEDWATFSQTWPRAGTTRNGIASPRQPSAPLTAVTDSSLWPTPTVVDMGERKSVEEWDDWTEAMKDRHGNGNGHGRSLSIEARRWPTPTVQDASNDAGPSQWTRNSVPLNVAVKMWPTPKGSPSGLDYARANREGSGGDDLATSVARDTLGQLNPTWVEWLMGFPEGWTDLEPSGTR